MTGPSLDLDTLREKAEAVGSTWSAYQDAIGTDGEVEACQASLDAREAYRLMAVPSTFLAVIAMVKEQRDRISTLEEALGEIASFRHGHAGCVQIAWNAINGVKS